MNVKELTLKKINADVNWSDLYIYALIKGESLEEIGNFILNPYISSVLNSYSSEDLTRDITDDKVEYIKKYFQEVVMLHGNDPSWEENINLHKRLIDYVVGAKEFSVLGKILKINQGFNTNTTELYTYIKSIEKYIESRLNKKLLEQRDKLLQDFIIAKEYGNKNEASKIYDLYLIAKNKVQTDWIKFDLMRFISDENYANEYINYYEKVKVLFNILEPIKIIPHYNVMYQTLFLAKQVLNTLCVRNKLEDIIWNSTIHKSLVSENSDITRKLTNNELKDLKKQINEFIINEWIYNQHLSIPIVKNAINNPIGYNLVLDNEKSLDTFIEYFENFVIPKLKSTLPDNKFISLLTFGYKDNKHFFRLPFDMMQIDSNEYTQSLYDDVLEAFNDLKYIKIEGIGNNLVDLFYLYNLIINKDKLGPSSLTRIFEDIVSEKDSFVYKFNTWLDNQNADDLVRKFFESKSEITKISEDDLDSKKDLTDIPLTEYTNYKINSGNDSKWSELSKIYGIKTIDYTDTYKELSNEDKEQIEYIYSEVAKNLKRNYYTSKDIRSNILQTLSADSIYAIGYIINPGELDNKGFKNELNRQIVNDDIIFTVEYGIIQKKPIYVFDQKTESWYKWDYNLNSFQKIDTPILTPNFTSIESKNLTESGINAITNVFEKTQEFIWGDNPNDIYDYNLDPEISFETYVNYTGFAQGSDTEWIEQSKLLGIDSVDTTKEYNNLNDKDKEDIEQKYLYVVDRLKRKVLDKDTATDKLVRRDFLQARNADSIIAIGNILKPNEFDSKGYENKTDKEQISGGTAYAIEFAKLLHKPIFVFNQRDNKWYFWDYVNRKYSETDTPILTVNFAGIGTREITESGKKAIQDVLNKTKQYFERNLSSDQLVTWAKTAENSYEVSTNGDSRFSALNAKFKEGTIIDGIDVSGKIIEDVYQSVIKKSRKGQAPSKESKLYIKKPESNPFNITNIDEIKRSQYAKDSGISIDHIESPTDKDIEDYQFVEIVIVTSNGDRIQLAPKAGFQDLNNVVKTKDIKAIIGINYLLENYLKSNPSEVNKFGNSVLSEYAKDVYKDSYDATKDSFQSDYVSYIKSINSANLSKEELEDYSYYKGYLPLWQEWARQNPELIEELKEKSKGKVLTDQFANTRVSQARALADILNEKNTNDLISQTVDFYSTVADEIDIEYTPKGKTTQTYTVKKSHIYNKNGKEVFTTDSVNRTKIYANVAIKENRAVIVNLNDSESYVVTNNNDIISITTGKLMKWNDTDSKRIKILELANHKFNNLNKEYRNKVKDYNEGTNILGNDFRTKSEIKQAISFAKKGISFEESLSYITPIFDAKEIETIKTALNGKPLVVKYMSRRTDPIFFTNELIDFLKENNKKPLSDPTRTNVVEIWSKHDGIPMRELLEACKKYKVAPIVSFSITGLGGTALEKGVLKYQDLLPLIKELIDGGYLNPLTTTIRIDPILVGYTNMEDIKNIIYTCKSFGIKKFVTSLVQSYGYTENTPNDRKVISGINEALKSENKTYDWDKYYGRNSKGEINFKPKQKYIDEIGKYLIELNKDPEIEIQTCAFTIDGLKWSACLDPYILEKIVGIKIISKDGSYPRNTSRPECMCYRFGSDFFRVNDKKCFSSCAYCYAKHSEDSPFKYYDDEGNLIQSKYTMVKTTISSTSDKSTNNTISSKFNSNTFKFNDGYEIETPFELNNEQKNALNKINDFIDSDKTVITLSGYAGTGKTSLMEILASKWSSEDKNVGFTATTHKATSILKSKVQKYGFKTYTMHNLFGIQPSVDLNMSEFDIRKTIDAYIAKKSYPNIIVIDEASMINQEHYNFIRELAERNDLKIIFIGDPAQLKPVKSTDISPVFKNNDGEIIFLTKVERTDNNAILKTATDIRNNKKLTYQTELNDKNEGIIYLQPSISLIKKIILDNIDLIKEDINSFKILAFTNKKVQTYNELVRSLLNYDEAPRIGEPIMMYDNKNRKNNQYQLINSEIYEIVNVEESQLTKYLENINDSVFLKGWNLYLKDIDGNISSLFVIKVNQNDVEDLKKISKEIKLLWTKYSVTKNYRIYEQIQDLQNLLNVDKNITGPLGNVLVKKVWDFGYAHTIHKSQGSTYEKVLIDGDDIELAQTNEDVKQLKYVGITRAQKQVFYISTNTKLNNGNSNSDEIKKIAENWSKLEGWNTNWFYSKVLPRINEGVQIFYKLSDDQDSSVKSEANMSFSYGDYKRSDIKSNNTIEAIKNGERTATTRFKNIEFWKSLKKGDRIKFVSKETGEYVIVEITEPARKIIPESQDFYKTKPSIKAQLIEFIKSADNKYLHITTDANLLNEDASIRNAKGFIRNGEIYINVDRATNDTIIHEFGHLYLALSKITDTNKYYKILSKVRQTNLWTKLRQWDSYKNKRGSDFDEEVLAFMISNYYQGDLTYKDIVNEILEIVPNEFKDLLNSDILPILDESIITNYRLQQKIATIKNKLYNDDILKEDCK